MMIETVGMGMLRRSACDWRQPFLFNDRAERGQLIAFGWVSIGQSHVRAA